jgi:hypothetical protein
MVRVWVGFIWLNNDLYRTVMRPMIKFHVLISSATVSFSRNTCHMNSSGQLLLPAPLSCGSAVDTMRWLVRISTGNLGVAPRILGNCNGSYLANRSTRSSSGMWLFALSVLQCTVAQNFI